jgi:hypothetical protein
MATIMRCGRRCRPLYDMKKLLCSQGYGKRDTCMLPVGCAVSHCLKVAWNWHGNCAQRYDESCAKCYILDVLSCKIRAYIYCQCHTEHTTVTICAWLNSSWLLLSRALLGWITLKLVTIFTVFVKIKCLNVFLLPCINQIQFQPVYHTVYTSPTSWIKTHHITASSITPQRTKWYWIPRS